MRPEHFIVSKTDERGRIAYANPTFIEFSGYSESELLGKQHNIVRHPDMPRGIFQFLWNTIGSGKECRAYVKNMARNGDHYWVFATVTPDFDPSGRITGYFSVRRAPDRRIIERIEPVYRQMCRIETETGPKGACEASIRRFTELLKSKGMTYEQFLVEV